MPRSVPSVENLQTVNTNITIVSDQIGVVNQKLDAIDTRLRTVEHNLIVRINHLEANSIARVRNSWVTTKDSRLSPLIDIRTGDYCANMPISLRHFEYEMDINMVRLLCGQLGVHLGMINDANEVILRDMARLRMGVHM